MLLYFSVACAAFAFSAWIPISLLKLGKIYSLDQSASLTYRKASRFLLGAWYESVKITKILFVWRLLANSHVQYVLPF